jgi:hypothetical protein
MKRRPKGDDEFTQIVVLTELLRMLFDSDLCETAATKRDLRFITSLPARYEQHKRHDAAFLKTRRKQLRAERKSR